MDMVGVSGTELSGPAEALTAGSGSGSKDASASAEGHGQEE